MSDDNFSLFTSMRYDRDLMQVPDKAIHHANWNHEHPSPCYMLNFHRDRMLRAATHWNWPPVIDVLSGTRGLETLSRLADETVGPSPEGPLRLKFVASRDGVITCGKHDTSATPIGNLFPQRLPPPGSTASPDDPVRIPEYTLLLDNQHISRSAYTHFKTTKREAYDGARQRAFISPADLKEVLVHQADGEIMEGTITTPYFWRNGLWVTPPVSVQFSPDDGSGGQDGTSRRWALERGIAVEQPVKVDSLIEGEECWISNGVRGFIAARISLGRGRSSPNTL